jgi:histidinol phosphatase-like PHP family hydrolase
MISDDTFKRLFDQTAEKNIAFEINTSYTKNMTPADIANDCHIRMFSLAKECGCKFTFGSDAHDSSYHDFYENADILAEILGIGEDDLADICK